MPSILDPDSLDTLARTPASDLKRLGWRGVLETVKRTGKVVVTNHDRPEAVILGIEEFDALLQAAQAGRARELDALAALRRRFDQRLATLDADDAGRRLRRVMRAPAKLGGKLKIDKPTIGKRKVGKRA